MTNWSDETDPTDGSTLPQAARVDPMHPGMAQAKDHPELIPVLTQAVDEVVNRSNLNREREADLVDSVERAATAAALTTYERMAASAIQAKDVAAEARRNRARSVAAKAEATAERVTVAAAEVHRIEEALADRLALIAANAASELAARVGLDDESAASVAAALVVEAVSEAAAVNAGARASAAFNVAQAAADAAADVAEEAASTALAADLAVITAAVARRRDALQTCFEAAAAAAQAAVLTQLSGAEGQTRHHSPELRRKPA